MSGLTFPIIEAEKNRLVAIDGTESSFYELIPPDLTQFESFEIDQFYEDISTFLNTREANSFFKFYSLNGKNYLSTNSNEVEITGVRAIQKNGPLELFFGGSDIYSNLLIRDDYLVFNGNYKRVLSVKEFGTNEIDYSFIPEGIDYILNIKRKENSKGVKQLERIRSAHLLSFSKNKRDIEGEGAYHQAEELLSSLLEGRDSIFEIELFFLVNGLSIEELNEKTKLIVNEMKARGVTLFIEGQSLRKLKTGLGTIFSELIPGVPPSFDYRGHTDRTTHLKYLLPLRRSFLFETGISLHDENDNEILFNPFSNEIQNKNILVTGSSGGGKSVFVNKLVHSLIENHPTAILDKGGSFKRITLYHGGVNLTGSFNPLQFKNPVYLREIILSVCGKESFTKKERGHLLKKIKEIMERRSELDNFVKLLNELEEDFNGISLYFEDVIHYFNAEVFDTVPILYVDVENYPKEAVAPLIIFILEYFKTIEDKEKILVFDEAWSFLKDHANYIDECFRTFRKSGALPIAISQGISDFAGDNETLYNAITNNSFIKVFFPQEKTDSLELNDFDSFKIDSLRFSKGSFSECYLKSGDKRYRKTIRIYLTPLELELFHTEAKEDSKFYSFYDEYRPYFKTNKETIDSYVRLLYGQD